ncbi:MAG: hypothetical protein E7642_05950 [Ruminococcaceae bacterium]|nr:hypothetical protein [Oscillospiraceae bacterium]
MKIFRILSMILVLIMLLSSCSENTSNMGNKEDLSIKETVNDDAESGTSDVTDKDNDKDDEGSGNLSEYDPPVVLYYVEYTNVENGTIVGETEQLVERGGSTTEVKAVANEGYVFAGWSDGVKLDTRRDENVQDHTFVEPVFVKVGTIFTVRYEVRQSGKIIEERELNGMAGNTVQYTAPYPALGYSYGEWNDGAKERERNDTVASDGETYVINVEPLSLGVPTLEITTDDGSTVTDRVTYKSCKVTLSNTDEEDCFENVNAQIRGRGNSSWSYPKKGIKLKFDNKRSMLGSEHKAKSWILISNYGDKSLIRNMIGYDLSDEMSGLKYTVGHKFIDVYLNGEYYGLFMITDKIALGDGRVELDETIYDDPSKMAYILEIGAANDDSRPNLIKNVDYFSAGRDKGRAYFVNYPESDDPAYIPEVHLAYIRDYVDQCLLALSNQDWELICELIDIDSFIDYYIIQELYMNKDCFWRSVHFYKEPNGKLYAGPVWDLDQGLGNVADLFGVYEKETTPTTDIPFANSSYNKSAGSLWIASCNTWYRRLVRNEEFIELLKQRLVEFEPIMMKVLKRATTDGSNPNSYYSMYSDAMDRNFERWTIMGVQVWPNTKVIVEITTVKGQIDYMRKWMIERYAVLCDYYGVTT